MRSSFQFLAYFDVRNFRTSKYAKTPKGESSQPNDKTVGTVRGELEGIAGFPQCDRKTKDGRDELEGRAHIAHVEVRPLSVGMSHFR